MPEHHIALQVLELMGLTLPRYAAFRRGIFAYPRPEHRSGRDDRRRGRERASFGRLGRHGREPESTSSAAAAAQLPRPTRRVGRTKAPAPRGLGTGVFTTGWVRFVGIGVQRHPTPNQRPQAARRSGCCPTPAAKQRQPVRLATLPRVGTLREADKGAQGSSPPASAPPSTKGVMQNERHGNAKRHANAQRGSANQHADYDKSS